MAIITPLIEEVIIRECSKEGFDYNKGKRFFHRKGRDDSFRELLFFDFCIYPHYRSVIVKPTVQNIVVQNMFEQIRGKKCRYPLWVVSYNLGYMCPNNNYKVWDFDEDTNIDEVCDTIFEDIRQYAYPFFDRMQNVDYLINAYEKREKNFFMDQRFIVLPLLYLLVNDKEKGISFLEQSQNDRIISEEFRREYLEQYRNYNPNIIKP